MVSTRAGRGRRAEAGSEAGRAALERRLGHRFAGAELLSRALTHPSAAPRGHAEQSYERLEFLGDRVLGLVVADLLVARFPQASEGELALRHAGLVRRATLAEVGRELGLGAHLIVAKGEEAAGERDNPALLADACEAVIGALYLDAGLAAARRLVEAHWGARIEAAREPPQDAKTGLQEWAQARGLPLPEYREVARAGPPHEPVFTVEVRVEGRAPARGEGGTKRRAELAAAERLLAEVRGGDTRGGAGPGGA